ncbi:CLUMA_CG008126, isoform A [Clunio marinus]|uniref:CLUMA_CG008126, isoform A n=1 Tax=Clunio marinus TaxID=568069 RepID=A0A1J1I4E2_9DIPT|nr:CLUMA_CG008126, isoform A [Clunio marinus]
MSVHDLNLNCFGKKKAITMTKAEMTLKIGRQLLNKWIFIKQNDVNTCCMNEKQTELFPSFVTILVA